MTVSNLRGECWQVWNGCIISIMVILFLLPLIGLGMGFLNGLVVNNLPAMQETGVWSLGGEDPLEEGMATHSSILARKIPWTEEPVGLQFIGSQRVRHNWSSWACTHSLDIDLWFYPGYYFFRESLSENLLKVIFLYPEEDKNKNSWFSL